VEFIVSDHFARFTITLQLRTKIIAEPNQTSKYCFKSRVALNLTLVERIGKLLSGLYALAENQLKLLKKTGQLLSVREQHYLPTILDF